MAVDLLALAVSLAGSGVAAWGAVKWFGDKVVDHALERRIEAFKSELERQTGDVAAEREYRFEARKRLAAVIGPLRFQLIQAAVLYNDRINGVARFRYTMSLQRYFGRSTLFRLGRLIAVIELIERQMAYLDFSVDDAMAGLMAFRAEVFEALSGGAMAFGHPKADWTRQAQHLFRDEITVIGTAMMTQSPDGVVRVVRVDEFNAVLGDGTTGYLEPLAGQIAGLDPTTTPILWLRLVAIAVLCDALVAGEPLRHALRAEAVDIETLVGASADGHVVAERTAIVAALVALRAALVTAMGAGRVVSASGSAARGTS